MDVESFLSNSVKSNSVCSCAFLCRKIREKSIITLQTHQEKKEIFATSSSLCTSYHVHTLLNWQACVQAIGNSACSQGQILAPCQALCPLWYNQNCLAKEPPQEPASLQKCILLIFEHRGSLESNFSILSLCIYTEEYSFDYGKLDLHWSVRENKPVNSIIKPNDRRNVLLPYYHLQHKHTLRN